MQSEPIHKSLSGRVKPVAIAALVLLAVLSVALGGDVAAATSHDDGYKALRNGDYEAAVKIFLDEIKSNPADVAAHNGAALAYLKLQRSRPCFEQALAAVKLDSSNARAHALCGLALLRSGYFPQAISELNAAINSNPKEVFAWEGLAEIDYYENRPKDARQKSSYASSLDSREPEPLITLARACSRLEMFAEAADAYERFLIVAPKTDAERKDRIRGLINFYRRLSGLHLHVVTGPKYADIPFRLGPDRRPYITVQLNGHDATFVLDTGSGFTVISEETASKFGIAPVAKGGTSQGVGGNGKFPIVYGLISSLKLGPEKLEDVPCFIRHFHNAANPDPTERADGFIGLSVLSNFVTGLNYKDQDVWLARSPEDIIPENVASPNATEIPFRVTQNGLISIETRIDDTNDINAILDSGASSTVISAEAVSRLKMSDDIIKGETVQVIGAAGVSDNVELLMIHDCKVAGLQQKNLRALILDFGAINETSGFEQSGILGGDFLRHYRVTIDFTRGRIILEPQIKPVNRTVPVSN
jgi:predicted aspartyl protease/Tfp pilus assembly protein PilF